MQKERNASTTCRNADAAPLSAPDTLEIVCRRCGGTGEVDGETCPDCKGTGKG